MLFFTSLMSFAGMSLNPMESHLMGNSGDPNTAASADQTSADNSDASSGSDAGSADFGDASGFDLGGGGFDSF